MSGTNLEKHTAGTAARELAERIDRQIAAKHGYQSSRLGQWLDDLLTHGRVEVGYRAACGKLDPTMRVGREWPRVLKALSRDGIEVAAEPVKHKNKSPTMAGGFWQSSIYTLSAKSPESK